MNTGGSLSDFDLVAVPRVPASNHTDLTLVLIQHLGKVKGRLAYTMRQSWNSRSPVRRGISV